jgi:hypothetical protein
VHCAPPTAVLRKSFTIALSLNASEGGATTGFAGLAHCDPEVKQQRPQSRTGMGPSDESLPRTSVRLPHKHLTPFDQWNIVSAQKGVSRLAR